MSVILIIVKSKVAAVLTVAALLGAMPITAGDLHLETRAAAHSSHDSACALVATSQHAKRILPVRDVLAAGARPFEIPPPPGHVFSLPRTVPIVGTYVWHDATAIRAPPAAT